MQQPRTDGEQRRAERRFFAVCAAAAALCVALAFAFMVPPGGAPAPASSLAPLSEALLVDLNTDGLEALCTLPGVGEKRAQAILDYRAAHGPFRQLSELLAIPGITEKLLASWAGQAVLSGG